ncbi:MAG: 50S ribosomal protein L25 [Pyrinomonadaceae bacterium]
MVENKQIVINARPRTQVGSANARRLRREGFVPVTVYGGDGPLVVAAAPLAEMAAILRSETGHNTIFTINIEGNIEGNAEGHGESEVIFYDRQIDPLHGRLVHADLKRLVVGEKIEVTVPLRLVGEPIGVREQGGILEQVIREIEIRCNHRQIPEAISVDVTNLKVHEVLHVSDIVHDDEIEVIDTPETVIATVGVVREEVVEPVAEVETTEPEVIGKGKKEDDVVEQ